MSYPLVLPTLRGSSTPLEDPYDFAKLVRAARGQLVGSTVPPERGLEYWVRWLKDRPRRRLDAVVVITGAEGTGKSTLMLRLILGIDPMWRPVELCYTTADVLNGYRTGYPGKPIGYDEGVRGLLAGETFTPEQVALVRAFAMVRELRMALFICVPSIFMLAKQVRARRATLWFHVQRRGRAIVHVRDDRLTYYPQKGLGLTVSPIAPAVRWDPIAPYSKIGRAYEAVKVARLNEYLQETTALLTKAPSPKIARARRNARYRGRVAKGLAGAKGPKSQAPTHAAVPVETT